MKTEGRKRLKSQESINQEEGCSADKKKMQRMTQSGVNESGVYVIIMTRPSSSVNEEADDPHQRLIVLLPAIWSYFSLQAFNLI